MASQIPIPQIRVPVEIRAALDRLVIERDAPNMSVIVREALQEFVTKHYLNQKHTPEEELAYKDLMLAYFKGEISGLGSSRKANPGEDDS